MPKRFFLAIITLLLMQSEVLAGGGVSKIACEVARPVKQVCKVAERTVKATGKVIEKVAKETERVAKKTGKVIGKGGLPLAIGAATGGMGLAIGATTGDAILSGTVAAVGAATGNKTKVGVNINPDTGEVTGTTVEVKNRVGQTIAKTTSQPESVKLDLPKPKLTTNNPIKHFGNDFFENIKSDEGKSFEAEKSFIVEDKTKYNFSIKQVDSRYYSEAKSTESSCMVSYLSKWNYRTNIGTNIWDWIKKERGITDFRAMLEGDEKRAASYYFFEATSLLWKFECLWLNGEEYCRCYVPGLEAKFDVYTPIKGNRGLLIMAGSNYKMPVGFEPESVRLKRQEQAAKKREFESKTSVQNRVREGSPEPLETTLRQTERKINDTVEGVYRDCKKYISDATPDVVKSGAELVFEYIKHGTPHCIKDVLHFSLDQIHNALTKLDESMEYSGTFCRRFLRDNLGVSQGVAQDAGDIVRLGGQVVVSLVPTAATQVATKAFRVMKLAPSGSNCGSYRVIIKEKEPKYKNVNLEECYPHTKEKITRGNWHLASLADRLQIQKKFIDKQILNKNWKETTYKIGGRKVYRDLTQKNIYYSKDGRHGDIEKWRVSGKTAYHEGSIEPIDGTLYRKPNHTPQNFE